MADEKKAETKPVTDSTNTTVDTSKSDAARNALFILISLLVIVFLIGLALIINRGLNNDKAVNTTADNTGLISSDTNAPSNSTADNTNTPTNNSTDNSPAAPPAVVPPAPTPEPTPAPEPTPTPTATPSVGTGASTESPAAASGSVLPTGHTEDGYKKSLSTQTEINLAGYWIPTQYIAGDIPANNGKYTVQYGDTLWWIAAGHYGDPFKWTTIEGANYAQIGFLPDGEHALIFPDQVLVLP